MSYSKTLLGEVGTDGVHRDIHGNPIPTGLDEETKAQLREALDGPKVRVLPSDHDVLVSVQGGSVAEASTLIDPNASADDYAKAYSPGYANDSVDATGEVPGSKADEAAKADAAPEGAPEEAPKDTAPADVPADSPAPATE